MNILNPIPQQNLPLTYEAGILAFDIPGTLIKPPTNKATKLHLLAGGAGDPGFQIVAWGWLNFQTYSLNFAFPAGLWPEPGVEYPINSQYAAIDDWISTDVIFHIEAETANEIPCTLILKDFKLTIPGKQYLPLMGIG